VRESETTNKDDVRVCSSASERVRKERERHYKDKRGRKIDR